MVVEYGRSCFDEDEEELLREPSRFRHAVTLGQDSIVVADEFYRTYNGHRPDFLGKVLTGLLEVHGKSATTIFLAGDSSLDNKAWLFNQGARVQYWKPSSAHAPAVNGLECILHPPRMVCDVAYWMNKILDDNSGNAFVINAAVEATTLASRVGGIQCCFTPTCGALYEQDDFIRKNIRQNDMLVISVGGNDVALMPSIFTILAVACLMLTPWALLSRWHPAVMYFVFMFRYQVQSYAEKLSERCRPMKIAACFIYNLDERNVSSWASGALLALCYCCFPGILQRRMRLAFELGTARVEVPGSTVVPIALADALDGKTTEDYMERVEPSVIGGQKIARLILTKLGWDVHTPGFRYEHCHTNYEDHV